MAKEVKNGAILEISDSGFVQELRKTRLKIQADLEKICEEFEEMERSIKKGGIREMGNATKSYYNMLIDLKKQRINAINAMSNNAKSAAELQTAWNNILKEIEEIKEVMANESGQTVKRPKNIHPYSTSKKK